MVMKKSYEGINFPGSTTTQKEWFDNAIHAGAAIRVIGQIKAGDIIFFSDGTRDVTHVAIATGPDEMVHSRGGSNCTETHPCKGVSASKISTYSKKPKYIYRITDPSKIGAVAVGNIVYSGTTVGISTPSDSVHIQGVGVVKSGGSIMDTLTKKISSMDKLLGNLGIQMNELSKENLKTQKNELHGDIDISKCLT
jgi:hypothetical protein